MAIVRVWGQFKLGREASRSRSTVSAQHAPRRMSFDSVFPHRTVSALSGSEEER